jgi:AmmeMemoRadiSam system protein B/AmmeMemoRadiSam system protein A
MLAQAGPREPTAMTGVVVPHAGHIYSGPVAASAYRLLPERVARVVLVGPSHFVPLDAIAASTATSWRTPLGEVPVAARELRELVERHPAVRFDDAPHGREHCLEVQLPFLQRVLAPGFELLPLAVGHLGPAAVADVLADALNMPDALLVVSTDLSHYLPYPVAAARDARTAAAILGGVVDAIGDDDACGAYALRGAMAYAAGRGLTMREVDRRSSGDTAGPRDRVVGYAAFVIGPPAPPPSDRGARLLALARRTIAEALSTGRQSIPNPLALDADLREPGASFVTLRAASTGDLLGCVGSMEAYRPLGVDVAAHALDAAFRDRRFAPLTAERAGDLHIGVSVLGPLRDFPASGYADLVARLPVGAGVFVCAGGYRATYLPQVWDELHSPSLFVASLWQKAGLSPGSWPQGISVSTYDVAEFEES